MNLTLDSGFLKAARAAPFGPSNVSKPSRVCKLGKLDSPAYWIPGPTRYSRFER
jgi:hypothetical protein